jgi:hypothetical protein
VYAKIKLSPSSPRAVVFGSLFLAVVFLCAPTPSRADSLEDTGRALARRAVVLVRGVSVACEARNLSTIPEAEFLSFTAAFRQELQHQNIEIVRHEEGARIVLTLSEGLDKYVGVVSVQRGIVSDALIELVAGNVNSHNDQSVPTMSLHKELMLSEEDPLVDADVYRYMPNLLDVLGQHQKATYEWKENRWERVYFKLLPRRLAAKRDLRGVVWHSVDASGGHYPGEACRSGMQPWSCEPSTMYLRPSSVDWELVENRKLPPWLSAAQFETNGQDALVITGEDGLARVYSQGPEAITTIPGWGSEIASTHSGCGRGWQILATGKEDWSTPDSVTGIEIDSERVTKVTESVDLPGPVITLHETASDKKPDRDMAIAVVKNLHTGFYEVYRLTITCSN